MARRRLPSDLHARPAADTRVARSLDDPSTDVLLSTEDEVLDEVASFRPEVIYYRPTIDQHPHLHALALNVLARHPVPLVTHIMDDWPSRLEAHDEVRGRKRGPGPAPAPVTERQGAEHLGQDVGGLRRSLRGDVRGDRERRRPRHRSWRRQRGRKVREERAQGGGAPLLRSARQGHDLPDARRRRSRRWTRCRASCRCGWRSTRCRPGVVRSRRRWRACAGSRSRTPCSATAFPPYWPRPTSWCSPTTSIRTSLRYIGLSMPNKLPEYLASGAALLAVGPREANGIDYVLSRRPRLLRHRPRSREARGGPPTSRHRLGLQERAGREGAGLGVRASQSRAHLEPLPDASSGRRRLDPPRGSRSSVRTHAIRGRASMRPTSSPASSRRWNGAASSSTLAPIMDPR